MAVLLEAPRPITAGEIQQRVPGYPESEGSFHRAFERDKDDLREMGVPLRIEMVPLSNPPVDGYRIRKQDYYLRDPGLDPDELDALNLAASTVRLDGAAAAWKRCGSSGARSGCRPATCPASVRCRPTRTWWRRSRA